jgi:protein SCO1
MATPTTRQPQSTAPRRPMRNNAATLRLISRLLVGALVVIVAAVLLSRTIFVSNQNTSAQLKGTSLGGTAAPNFTLTDQNGNRVSLADLRGHPVVLTFFYTHCTDECPLTASKFQSVLKNAGSQLTNVRWVAVSTDPVGDTPQSATNFAAKHGLTGTLHYLLGTQAELEPVWSAYSVAVAGGATTPGADDAGKVQHTGGVWLIDAQGHERVYLDAAFAPNALADDLKILAGSK